MKRIILIILFWGIALILISFAISGLHKIDLGLGAIWGAVIKSIIAGSSIALTFWLYKLFFPIALQGNNGNEETQRHQEPSAAETFIAPIQENKRPQGPALSPENPEEVKVKQPSNDEKNNLEIAQGQLDNSLEALKLLKEKNVLSDAEFEEAKNRAQEKYERQKQLNEQQKQLIEQQNSKMELQAEFDKSMAELVALTQQGVIDSTAFEVARGRLIQSYGVKGIESVVLHKGSFIEKQDDKYFVDGKGFKSLDTAKAYIDMYKT